MLLPNQGNNFLSLIPALYPAWLPICITLTTRTEVEEWGKRAVVGELGSKTSEFIKEAVGTGL